LPTKRAFGSAQATLLVDIVAVDVVVLASDPRAQLSELEILRIRPVTRLSPVHTNVDIVLSSNI